MHFQRINKKIVFLIILISIIQVSIYSQDRTNTDIVREYIENEVLPGRKLTILWDVDNIISELGQVYSEKIVAAKINYEGMLGESIRRLQYDNFYACFYQLNNGREIFGYIEPRKDKSFLLFNYGMKLDEIIKLNGSHIQNWGDRYIIFSSFRDIEAYISITVDSDMRITEMKITIGLI